MKKCHLSFLSLILIIMNCSSVKNKPLSHCPPILDSIKYVTFPNDDYQIEGNYYFQKIVSIDDRDVMCLIEKIKDTTQTEIRIADSYNYCISDLAILLLPYASKGKINIQQIVFEQFENQYGKEGRESDFFESIYYDLYISNSKEINYKNRLILYNLLKSRI